MFYNPPKHYLLLFLSLLIVALLTPLFFYNPPSVIGAEDCCHHECNTSDPKQCQGDLVFECSECDGDIYQDWCQVEDCTASSQVCSDGVCQTVAQTCIDEDEDGYGNPASTGCTYSELDCDDTTSAINPSTTEVCGNTIDEDCDGTAQTCSAMIINIEYPERTEYTQGSRDLFFQASILNGTMPYNYNWSSNIDGELYNGLNTTFFPGESAGGGILSIGNHIITLTITDYNGLIATKNIFLTIINSTALFSPINTPITNSSFAVGTTVYFYTWTDNAIGETTYKWESSIDGIIGNEADMNTSTLSL